MSDIIEKIDSPSKKGGFKKKLKKRTNRCRRRAAKKDIENAGTKLKHFTRGWTE